MGSYLFTHSVTYLSSAFVQADPLASPVTIGDGDADSSFESGDTFNNVSLGGNYTYAGTTVIDGNTWPVWIYDGPPFGYHVVFMDQAAVSPPATLSITAAAFPTCYFAGSLIRTDQGERDVEELEIGTILSRPDGTGTRVKWIGRQTVSTRFGPAERLRPVRFAAGSLGDGLPHSDLTVTADHGMLVEDIICHAGALVNGTTITRVPLSELGESYTVYHVETESHEIILANGAPAETFIDNVSRRTFDNFGEFEALYGEVPEMEELPYPRAMSARQVPGHIQARLAAPRVA